MESLVPESFETEELEVTREEVGLRSERTVSGGVVEERGAVGDFGGDLLEGLDHFLGLSEVSMDVGDLDEGRKGNERSARAHHFLLPLLALDHLVWL